MTKKSSAVNKPVGETVSKPNGAKIEKASTKTAGKGQRNGKSKTARTPSSGAGTQKKSTSLRQRLAQREAELAIINSIQQGLAAKLDFQTIVELVGDRLRELLNTGDLSINWYNEKANLVHYLYAYEHGKRLE